LKKFLIKFAVFLLKEFLAKSNPPNRLILKKKVSKFNGPKKFLEAATEILDFTTTLPSNAQYGNKHITYQSLPLNHTEFQQNPTKDNGQSSTNSKQQTPQPIPKPRPQGPQHLRAQIPHGFPNPN
jgi:hypothetical protein